MPDSSERPPDWPATEQSPWARPLMRGLMRLLARSDVQGAENVPAPPVLITTNHLSYFDIPALAPSLPPGVIGTCSCSTGSTPLAMFGCEYTGCSRSRASS